jgi:ribonuclease P protein component
MPRAARPEGYSRRHRFTELGAFGPVIRGSRKVRGALTTLHIAPNPCPPGAGALPASRFGLALTRRMVPHAVARNRIKRIGREIFRRHAVRQAGLDLVLMMRTRIPMHAEAAFREELAGHFDQALLRVDQALLRVDQALLRDQGA